jgi:hypothetical protein
VLAVTVLLLSPVLFSFANQSQVLYTRVLAASSNSPYTENLSLYLTSSETFWRIDLAGGNISVNSVSVPSSVSGYSIVLTHYTAWKSQFEIFTRYGFGLLGPTEPYPDGAVLTINASSQSDAASLANSLSQRFGLAFQLISTQSNAFTYFSPISFSTEVHVFFWQLIQQSYKGFASLVTENQLESNDLNYYKLSYSSTGPAQYTISYGGLSALSSDSFKLYSQLGLLQTSYNYSSLAQSSTIQIHILGGLVTNASSPFVNNFSNLSASIITSRASGNHTNVVPNINATLDFSFPTILAYRQVSPTLTPSKGSNVSVTIFVRNVSPTSTPGANNVRVNDSWIYQNRNDFNLTVGQTGKVANLSAGATETLAYAFTVVASGGTIKIPATPVTYQFSSANKTVTATAYLNPETLIIGGNNNPSIEATENLPSGSIQAGQTFSVNVTIVNKGSGAAFSLVSDGLSKSNLPAGSTWSYLANATSGGLTSTNSTVSYAVSWKDASGTTSNTTTNTMSAVFSFGSPGTPAMYLDKAITLSNTAKSANVTLTVFNGSPSQLVNVSVVDPIPTGVAFGKSFNTSSLKASSGFVNLNISSLKASTNESFAYSINFTNPNENLVFLPTNISTEWNEISIVHYGEGIGLPLGVKASKVISPSVGFQGTNVTVSVAVVNQGSLPVFDINLGNSFDQFLQITSNSSATTQAVLSPGSSVNRNLAGYLTGNQGTYNTSASAATFLFAGSNQTASSNTSKVTVYALPSANSTFSGLKIEEAHNIVIGIVVKNPSNVSISGVAYSLHVPKGLTLVSGNPNFTIGSMGPDSTQIRNFTVITSQPNAYTFNNASLTFIYQNSKVKGNASTFILNIADDIPLRYGIPIVIGAAIVLGTLFYVRRERKV